MKTWKELIYKIYSEAGLGTYFIVGAIIMGIFDLLTEIVKVFQCR